MTLLIVLAAGWAGLPSSAAPVEAATAKTGGEWVPRYYFRRSDGSILKKRGLTKIGRFYYYLDRDYSRSAGFKRIRGRYYYFSAYSGRRYEKPGWRTIRGKKYFFLKNHSVATGLKRIDKKYYLFDRHGVLQVNQFGFHWKDRFYNTDRNGVAKRTTATQVRCMKAAWQYINAHSSPAQSPYERYRSCFNHLESYLNFHPRSWGYYDFSNPDWPYVFALDVFEHSLIGDCFGFASCMAVIGKALGYQTTVFVAREDHAFVIVDGKFIDNDWGGLFFSTRSHDVYTLYKKATL